MEHSSTFGNPAGSEFVETSVTNEASSSGISWSAVIAGAFVAAALSLILFALGTGLGFATVSPWSNNGAYAATLGMVAIAWLVLTQIMASAMGGYLAGRLRTKWAKIHTDEVYFRDTAHGLLMWAVGMVITVGLFASAATSMAGGSGQSHAGVSSSMSAMAEGGRTDAGVLDPNAYFVDVLFRTNHPILDQNDAAVRGEGGRIFANALRQGKFVPLDKTYLSTLIVARTGLTQADAEQRVSQVFMQAQQAIDTARKALVRLSLWIFIALLAGAFCASYAATIGGKQRDHVRAI